MSYNHSLAMHGHVGSGIAGQAKQADIEPACDGSLADRRRGLVGTAGLNCAGEDSVDNEMSYAGSCS